MNKKRIIFILLSLVGLLAVAAVVYVLLVLPKHSQTTIDPYATNDNYVFEVDAPPADPAMVGKWQNSDNPQWYKVYYDDYDGDGYYWGKEWNEDEDVFEEDLQYHGNGWYRWRRDGKQLVELHTMDMRDVPIAKQWRVKTEKDSLVLFEPEQRKQYYSFSRAD